MKPFIIIAFCGILAVYGQASNETVVEVVSNAGNTTDVVSVEIPDASVAVVEPIESKQTVSLQSAEKPIVKAADDDNSNLVANAVDSTNNAIKDASDSIASAAESAKSSANSAADTISRKATEVRQSAEHGVNGVVENSSASTFIASSLVLVFAFINSIHFI
uniref:Uncharacterized protein n=1 Tax=Panagrolaimus superbus TaxID=310955 RepID=A0A914YV77_9BILA